MAKARKESVGRRGFLKGAAASAAAVSKPHAAHAQAALDQDKNHKHDHEHQAVPSDLTLRVKALESLLVEKGWSIGRRSMRWSTPTKPRSARATARGSSRAPGSIRLQKTPDGRRQRRDCRARLCWQQGEDMVVVENTPKVHNMVVCTLCSCYPWPIAGAPAGLVQVGALSLARGHRSARRAARVRHGAARRTSRCGSGTARRTSATSCCRNDRPGTEA